MSIFWNTIFDGSGMIFFSARHGKNLSAMDIVRGLKACYGLSTSCAMFLSFGGYILLRKFRRVSLYEIGKHNAVEHNASLVHHDILEGQIFAPIEIDHSLVDALVSDVKPSLAEIEKSPDPTAEFLMNYEDVARARIRREAECNPVDNLHAEIARGEMALVLGLWELKTKEKIGIPVDYLKRWIGEESLPDGWKPDHTLGLLDLVRRTSQIRNAMNEMRKEQLKSRKLWRSPIDNSACRQIKYRDAVVYPSFLTSFYSSTSSKPLTLPMDFFTSSSRCIRTTYTGWTVN